MGKLEMKFENRDKHLAIMMDGIESDLQLKILELCMTGIQETAIIENEPDKKQAVEKKGYSEEELKTGYQTIGKPLLEPVKAAEKDNKPKELTQKIDSKADTYQKDKSIKVKLGIKHYQLFYICPNCGNKGKHHIVPGTAKVHCHNVSCSKEMMVRLATPRGLPDHDEWGNYFIAGEFRMTMKDKEDEDRFMKSQDKKEKEQEKEIVYN